MTNTLTETRCSLTELITTMCAHCRGHQLAPELVIARAGRARQPGTCAGCDTTYPAGTLIAITAAGDHLCRGCV
jgi:hypothetical protein